MRISILAATALAAALMPAALVPAARAQTTVIERGPGVTVERREAPAVVEKRTIETTGSTACSSKTTTKTNEFGDTKTVRKESCD